MKISHSLVQIFTLAIAILSVQSFAQWERLQNPASAFAILSEGEDLYALAGDSVYRTSDFGNSWATFRSPIDSHPSLGDNFKFTASGRNLLLSTKKVMFLSKNKGESWQQINQFPKGLNGSEIHGNVIYGFLSDSTFLHVGFCKSLDFGSTWDTTFSSFTSTRTNYRIQFMGITENLFFAVGANGDIYHSYDSGKSWSIKFTMLPGGITSIAYNDSVLLQGADNTSSEPGYFVNSKNSWVPLALPTFHYGSGTANFRPIRVSSVALKGWTMFCGTDQGVFSTPDTSKPFKINEGLSDSSVKNMAIAGEYLFITASNSIDGFEGRIWRRPLNNIPKTSIDATNRTRAISGLTYRVDRFNSTIKFILPSILDGQYQAVIYDVSGHQVHNISGTIPKGHQGSIIWDVSQVARGHYFIAVQGASYRLRKTFLLTL